MTTSLLERLAKNANLVILLRVEAVEKARELVLPRDEVIERVAETAPIVVLPQHNLVKVAANVVLAMVEAEAISCQREVISVKEAVVPN